jgi:hypothetical protein
MKILPVDGIFRGSGGDSCISLARGWLKSCLTDHSMSLAAMSSRYNFQRDYSVWGMKA